MYCQVMLKLKCYFTCNKVMFQISLSTVIVPSGGSIIINSSHVNITSLEKATNEKLVMTVKKVIVEKVLNFR